MEHWSVLARKALRDFIPFVLLPAGLFALLILFGEVADSGMTPQSSAKLWGAAWFVTEWCLFLWVARVFLRVVGFLYRASRY